MKIDKTLNIARVKQVDRASGDDAETDEARRSEGAAIDKVAISKELGELAEIAKRSPVDETELSELKDAIRSGDYRPDLESLATRLMSNPDVMGNLINE
jgi:flagellar biosynthesis anti-sigma factor FlgM